MCYSLIRKFLFLLDAERAHDLTLWILKKTLPLWGRLKFQSLAEYPVNLWGITFPNPIGLAAGLDKNGDYIEPLQNIGFGFIEVGTVTPRPQIGNPRPRIFRIPDAYAIINRMGFNNKGVDHLVENLKKRKSSGIIGANIGKNFDTSLENASEDYIHCLGKVYAHVDYVVINISSPNSPGLRDLQSAYYLDKMLANLDLAQQQLQSQGQKKIPFLIKIDPDLNEAALEEFVSVILKHQVDGVIATNTTVNHRLVAHLTHGHEQGGLSGEPLLLQSTQILQKLTQLLAGKLPVVGCGGVSSANDASEKFAAGASLVQIYTGLIYKGPSLIRNILENI
ncbi:MAG: quinone-dependent dihydroorotate dehydrogenase [Proteobacteria bacterium]|nr:quinone-dependent dihydroorotate dehydrogenase [Pseudomonadota bacterium]